MPEHLRCIQCFDLLLHWIDVWRLFIIDLQIRHIYVVGPGLVSTSPPSRSSLGTQGDRCPPAEKTAALEGKSSGSEGCAVCIRLLSSTASAPQLECCTSRTDCSIMFKYPKIYIKNRMHKILTQGVNYFKKQF